MPREIKTKISVDGEAAFKKSLKSINSELNVLSSELGAVTSGFDMNKASMRQLKTVGAVLEKQLEQQKIKVAALNGAVSDSKTIYDKACQSYEEAVKLHGKESEEAEKAAAAVEKAQKGMDYYTIQLNKAKKTLNETETAFERNNKEAKKLSRFRISDLFPEDFVKKVKRYSEPIGDMASKMGKAAKYAADIEVAMARAGVEASAKALTAYAAAAASAAVAVTNLTGESAQFADDINTMSKQTGIATDELQKMSYAAKLIDVDVDTVTKSMAKLTKNMTSSSKDVQAAFDTLGVSVRDNLTGELRDNQEVFNELITALGQVENETERDNLAMQIFGKSAQELNPLIEGGAEKLKELGDSAEETGLILSQEALDSLNAYNDSLDTMKANASAAGNVIAVEFAPKLQTFTDKLGKSLPGLANSFGKMFGGDKTSSAAFRTQARALSREINTEINNMLPDILNGLNTVIAAVGDNVPEMAATILPTLVDGLKKLALELTDIIPELLPLMTESGAELFMGLVDGLAEVVDKLTPMLPDIIGDVGDKILQNAPLIIDAGFNLLIAINDGIAEALPELAETAGDLVPEIATGILSNTDKIIQAGVKLIIALAKALTEAIPDLLKAVPQIVGALFDELGNVDWFSAGAELLSSMGDGLVSVFSGALGLIDGLFGTKLEEWGNAIFSFWQNVSREIGAMSYEFLNADKIAAIEMDSVYGSLDDYIIQYSNELMRGGMAAAEALGKAKNEYLDTAEKIMYFEQNFANDVTAETAEQRRQILLETGQIYGTAEYNAVQAAEAEKAAAEETAKAEKAAAEEAKNAKIKALGESRTAALEALDKEEAEYEKSVKEQTSAAVSSYNSRVSAYENSLSSEKAALKKANSEKVEELKKQQKEESKLFEKAAKAELEELKKAHNEKLKLIDEEYTEKLKLVDEERYNQIKAIDDEIAAINGLTEAEEKAAKAAQQQEKLTELQNAVNSATTTEDRQAAEKELAEYKKELEQERILAEREARISELESKKDDINEEYDLREENLKAEYELKEEQEKERYEKENELLKERQEAEKTALSEKQTAELTALNERNEAALSGLDTVHKQRLADLEAEKEQEISNIKAVGEAQLAEYKKTMAAKRVIVEAENAAQLFDVNLGGSSSLLGGAGAALTIPEGFLKAVYSAENGAALSASGVTNNSTTTNNNSTKNITIVNNSPTALSPYEQTKKNEQQLKAAKLYG
jgi:hypothetical protein